MVTSDIFTGASRYSRDFESVINRSVAIASLPLTQLKTQKSALDLEAAALSSLDTKLSALQSALTALNTAAVTNPMTASVGNSTVASAQVTAAALAGTYTLKVISPGTYTISTSSNGLTTVTNPATQNISSDTSFTLEVNGVSRTITPSAANLNALAAAINASTGNGVTATVVNLGASGSPDYRLALQSRTLGADTISLTGAGGQLLALVATGTTASYQVNGITTTITSTSRSITLAPGLTVHLLAAGDATITVSNNTEGIRAALSNFAAAYNAVVDELDLHRGSGNGVLKGHSIISHVNSALRSAIFYSTGGGIPNATKLGLTLDKDGHASVTAADFTTAAADSAAVLSFLGGTSTTGFLKHANDIIDSFQNISTGTLKKTITSTQDAVTRHQARIEETQDRIDSLRNSLNAQFAAADSLIASLEQHVLYLQGIVGVMLNPSNRTW